MADTPSSTAQSRDPRQDLWCSALFDLHPHAVLVLEPSGRLLHANRAAEWLAGGGWVHSVFDLIEPPTAQSLRAALREGRTWSGPLAVRTADANSAMAQLHVLTVTSPVEGPGEMVCIVERAAYADRMPALLWQADAAFAFHWVSQGFVTFTGRAVDQLLGLRWLECVHCEDRERATGIFVTSQQAHLPFSMDLHIRRHDGEYRCMLLHAAPSVDGYAGLCLDIHERHRIETQLAEHTESRRRTDLRQGHFLAALSHELRSPLAPIANAASVLRTLEADNPTLLRLREILERQVARIRRVLDDLIDVTQALQGEIMLARKPVSVQEVVDSAIAQNQRTLDAMGHRVNLAAPPRQMLVDGDSVRLAQMLSSILANAAKFTPEPSTIGISIAVVDDQVRVAIKDPGHGIAADFLPRVFDLFAQHERGPRGGLGVGLTLAKRIAQYHGGDVAAYSEGLGRGAEFIVSLPLVSGSSANRAAPRRATPQTASPEQVDDIVRHWSDA